jgi:hypothetical protein
MSRGEGERPDGQPASRHREQDMPPSSQSLSLASLAPTSRMLRQQVLTRKQIDRTHRPTEHSRTHSRHNMSFNTLHQQYTHMQAGQSERLPHTHTHVLAAVGVKNANPELLF